MAESDNFPIVVGLAGVFVFGMWLDQHPTIKAILYFISDHFVGIALLIVIIVGYIMWKRSEY